MKPLLPPTRADVARNLRLLAEEWRTARPLLRYFIASQFASGALAGCCSLAALVAGAAGLREVNVGLLAAATLCVVHTLTSWQVLKKRFQVRYEIW